MPFSPLQPSALRPSLSECCRGYYDAVLALAHNTGLNGTSKGGIAGQTLVGSKRGVLPVTDLSVGDAVLDHLNGGYVKVLDILSVPSGDPNASVTVKLPSTDPLSTGSVVLHPAQPVLLANMPSVNRIFTNGPAAVPALLAGPLMGGHLQTGEQSSLVKLILERSTLLWTVERPIPCLASGQSWADLMGKPEVSRNELRKWLFIYGFRVENFFRDEPVDQYLKPNDTPVDIEHTHGSN